MFFPIFIPHRHYDHPFPMFFYPLPNPRRKFSYHQNRLQYVYRQGNDMNSKILHTQPILERFLQHHSHRDCLHHKLYTCCPFHHKLSNKKTLKCCTFSQFKMVVNKWNPHTNHHSQSLCFAQIRLQLCFFSFIDFHKYTYQHNFQTQHKRQTSPMPNAMELPITQTFTYILK